MKTRSCLLAALVAASSAGCKKDEPAPQAKPVAMAPAPKPEHKAAPVPANNVDQGVATPSKPGASDRECVGAIDTAVPKEVTIAGRKAELNGYKLTFKDKDADDEARFGVISSINDASPENLFNLKRYLDWFKAEKAEALIVDGDTGDTEDDIEQVIERSLTLLAESGLPVFVEIGNHECKSDYNDALIAVQKKFDNVVDLGKVRYVDYDDADLVSLPGYHDAAYVHCTAAGGA
jgi:hypothetical protein